MDYLGYYKLVLQKAYGGEFPGMSSEEFDHRCSLKKVPTALKALYMALGTQRICPMHCLIPMPEELFASGAVVVVYHEDDRVWAVDTGDLAEENPLIQVKTGYRTEADGTETCEFANDGETRLAVQMANLIAYSANLARKIRKDTEKGFINRMRNAFALITRKRELLLDLLCLVLIFIVVKSRILFILSEKNPDLGVLSVVCVSSLGILPMYSLLQWHFYWNVRLGWLDNTRFVSTRDECIRLIHNLTFHYLLWNRPDLWFGSGDGNAGLHSEVALSDGPERFCQCRYELISGESGTLNFPDTPPISYTAEKQSSILMRTTLDDSGCLRFVHVDAHCDWRLPARRPLALKRIVFPEETLQEDMSIKTASPELVPADLRDLLRKLCAEFPGIRTAWCYPAVMEGNEVYLLSVIADGEVDLRLLLRKVFISDRPVYGVVHSEAGNLESIRPLYSRGSSNGTTGN